MTGAALLAVVVRGGLGRMATAAQAPCRRQARNNGARVTRIALLMREVDRRVPGFRIRNSMTRGARARRRMVIGMTVVAPGLRGRGSKRDRRGVTFDARLRRVS